MEAEIYSIAVTCIKFEYSTQWTVLSICTSGEIISKTFIYEDEYKKYVNSILPNCQSFVLRSFSIKSHYLHDFDGDTYCKYDLDFEKPSYGF